MSLDPVVRCKDVGKGRITLDAIIWVFVQLRIDVGAGGSCKLEIWEYTNRVNGFYNIDNLDELLAPQMDTQEPPQPIHKANTWSEVGNRGAKAQPELGQTKDSRSYADVFQDDIAAAMKEIGKDANDCPVELPHPIVLLDLPTSTVHSMYLYQVWRVHSGCPGGGSRKVRFWLTIKDGKCSSYPESGRPNMSVHNDYESSGPSILWPMPDEKTKYPDPPSPPDYWHREGGGEWKHGGSFVGR